jgi:hypothetical protein
VFVSNQIQPNLSGAFKTLKLSQGDASILVMGNFDVVPQTSSVTFQSAGTWYDYLNGTTITATGAAQSFTLLPGEYHVYLNMNAALPVILLNFNGKNNGGNNLLSWAVENEQDFSHYELQRSINGQDFSFVTDINATGKNNYSYIDDVSGAASSIYFYRLKNIDKDGRFSYSAVVKIRMSLKGMFIDISPNPFVEQLNMNIESFKNNKATLVLTDLSGRQLFKKNISLLPGINAFKITEAAKFSKGTYLLNIISSQQTQSIKIVKGN